MFGSRHSCFLSLALLFIPVLLLSPSVVEGSAQSGNASLSGRVLDPSGAVIQGASVILRSPDGSPLVATSDEVGTFRFEGLAAAAYELRVEASDFRTVLETIEVRSGEHRIVNRSLQLDPGLVIQERVMVVASPSEATTIPGSAHYVGGDQLEKRKFAFDDINKLLAPVPGVNIQEEEGFGLRPNIGMRGTGVERSAKITLMEDGVLIAPAPYAAPSAYYFPVSGRMEAVEVRKGSSAIKFGPQSNGGALNLISSSIPDSLRLAGTISGGAHGTAKGHVRIGDSYDRFGWLLETYQIDTKGFKKLDGGGDTGFKINDYVGKFRFNSGTGAGFYQAIEIKLGKTNQTSEETYLGVTDQDFDRDPRRRYAASQNDVFYGDHEQYQARYFTGLGPQLDITVTAYRNKFARNWYKLQSIDGISIAKVLADPVRYADELSIAKGGDSGVGALRVRANNRAYVSSGVGSVLGLRRNSGNVRHNLEFGVRYHRDEEDRFQHEDGFRMSGGRMVLTSAGAPGSQSNRLGEGRALAFFVEDKLEWGRLTLRPGFRYERIELIRTDYFRGDASRTAPTRVRRNTLDVFVPGVGLTFDVGSAWSLFAGVNKGFGPPGPGSTEDTDAEDSVNYEGGFRWNRSAAQVELVGFYNDYSNLLGSDTLSTGGEGTGAQFNGGAARVVGIEASTSFNLAPALGLDYGLPVRVVYTFTDAQFQSDFDSDFGAWGEVRRGGHIPYLPAHNFNAGVTIEKPRWSVDLSASYMSRMRVKAGSGNIPALDATDARLLLDLTGEYQVSEGTRLFAGIQNLTDETYIAARRPAGARAGLPRTFMAGLKFDIGK